MDDLQINEQSLRQIIKDSIAEYFEEKTLNARQCQAITKSGNRCCSTALPGMDYCGVHRWSNGNSKKE